MCKHTHTQKEIGKSNIRVANLKRIKTKKH